MDEVAKKRAERTNDSRKWTAKDALEDAIKRIEGKTGVMMSIQWWEFNDDGSRDLNYSAANLTYDQHITLLEVAKLSTVKDWIKD